MFNKDTWQEIWHSMRNNKLRTFLTGFSVAWGIFILVLLLASVNGMQNGFEKQFNDDATNSIFIYPNATSKPYGGFEAGRRIRFKNDDLDFIKGSYASSIEYFSPRFNRSMTFKFKQETGAYGVVGVSPDHQQIERSIILNGRYLNIQDVRNKQKVMVIGRQVQKELFKDEDPVGQNLIANGLVFKVIGVFGDDGNEREESNIYAPYTTMQQIFGNSDQVNTIAMTYNPEFDFTRAMGFGDTLEEVLKRRLTIHPEDQSAFFVNNFAEGFSNVQSFSSFLKYVAIGVGVLILIAGIVGIGNILIFIIKERTKEIGVRKALGARPIEIIKLILLESIVITTLSGFGGMLFSMGIVAAISPLVDAPAFSNPNVDNTVVITCTVVLIFAGVLAGLIPSIRAANVKPIEALRAD
ncbi:putative ABC transport system permease protein [Robiginitalea myxolifaciens]|uniref:Putative ABC transport system permease protein n=1 Tax=Robiginitalea myxolifaciens TaxID=400055 RepID=A0A1I6FT45_9FLAO|nr:ABC transporter permease [Robiginitalea myxolifaciens]SFR33074.1 putative ABC transport system permease protein [Robiginitalea myxolifaciens]